MPLGSTYEQHNAPEVAGTPGMEQPGFAKGHPQSAGQRGLLIPKRPLDMPSR